MNLFYDLPKDVRGIVQSYVDATMVQIPKHEYNVLKYCKSLLPIYKQKCTNIECKNIVQYAKYIYEKE